MAKKSKQKTDRLDEEKKFPVPVYEDKDDIYNREKEVPLKDEDNTEKIRSVDSNKGTADDLDIPGTELDDTDETIGEEDEENNYYSLGGDRHGDLEEDNG